MKKVKVFLPFCRTLLSQSAASITVGSIAGFLEIHGFVTELFLLEKNNSLNISKLYSRFYSDEYIFIVAKVNFQDYYSIFKILEQLKADNKKLHIAICGPFASKNYESIILAHKFIDAVLVGQPEVAALEFLQVFSERQIPSDKQFSFAYRNSSLKNSINIPITTKIIPLSELPFPKRSIEAQEIPRHVNIEASRGCYFNCSFCHLSKTSVSYRSPEAIVKEIVYLNKELGKTFFIFNDSCFWSGPTDNERIIKIADGIIKESLNIRFYVYLRIKPLIPNELLSILKKAGLVRVFLGVESGVYRIKQEFNKPSREDEFLLARHLFENEYNVNVHIGFITIEPTSSLSEVESNIDYLMSINKLFRIGIIIEPMRVVPGSMTHIQLLSSGLIDNKLKYSEITYGYKFKHDETFWFLKGIQKLFRCIIKLEAHDFEYYSTIVGLAKVMAIEMINNLPLPLESAFQTILNLRLQGMALIYKYLKVQLSNFQENTSYTMSFEDDESKDFINKFKLLSQEIKKTHEALSLQLNCYGCENILKEIYTGLEGVNE